jgi:hypothetical protein
MSNTWIYLAVKMYGHGAINTINSVIKRPRSPEPTVLIAKRKPKAASESKLSNNDNRLNSVQMIFNSFIFKTKTHQLAI